MPEGYPLLPCFGVKSFDSVFCKGLGLQSRAGKGVVPKALQGKELSGLLVFKVKEPRFMAGALF